MRWGGKYGKLSMGANLVNLQRNHDLLSEENKEVWRYFGWRDGLYKGPLWKEHRDLTKIEYGIQRKTWNFKWKVHQTNEGYSKDQEKEQIVKD